MKSLSYPIFEKLTRKNETIIGITLPPYPSPSPSPWNRLWPLKPTRMVLENTSDLLLFDCCTLRIPVYISFLFSFIFVRSFSYSSYHSLKLDKNDTHGNRYMFIGVLYCLYRCSRLFFLLIQSFNLHYHSFNVNQCSTV